MRVSSSAASISACATTPAPSAAMAVVICRADGPSERARHRRTAVEPGVLTYIMVDSIETTSATITGTGGEITKPLTPLDLNGAAFATFRDPAGNLFGLYQEGHR